MLILHSACLDLVPQEEEIFLRAQNESSMELYAVQPSVTLFHTQFSVKTQNVSTPIPFRQSRACIQNICVCIYICAHVCVCFVIVDEWSDCSEDLSD